MKTMWLCGAAISALALAACDAYAPDAGGESEAASAEAAAPTQEDAAAFLERAEAELAETSEYAARVYWVQNTYINHDTNWLASRAGAESTELSVRLAEEAAEYADLDLPQEMQRKLNMLRSGITIPAPADTEIVEELSEITTRLESTYSTGTFEIDGEGLTLNELSNIIENSRDREELREVWEGWRTVSPVMAEDYARMVEIANDGANHLGFDNLAQMWLSNYDMPADEMEAEVERLWGQVEPLYEQLHCAVRAELNEEYGDAVQPADGPIRADLLGNMWAQQWSNIYPLVGPEDSDPGYDLTTILNEQGYDARRMVETGEAFFSSLGFEPLPDTFWERSLITEPEDRDVVCHPSAWNLDNVDDIRIKMCTEINAEDFQTVHHELGHNYYQRAYNEQDFLFRTGAHDGFHEAIGDFVGLSITPEYLRQIGLIDEVPPADADLGILMNQALDKIAFLPFGLMVDKWRWSVFRGETTPENYNEAWWELRTRYQGVAPPGPRPDDAFDPGAKYHIPGNTPYLRYFLSFIMQFQFHQAACEMAGWEGPLHRCSIYGNEEVGERFNAMLEAGASEPWPDVLERFTGTREMDGSAIIAYFEPLMDHLEEANADRECGW
ncbi:peptidyl-dipeptidase [Marinicauda salina]|uniref:Peptidyl-dipeptidase n=1 Tax=Marinicauda salina TaxID=2135793 RepID=A0A2U2BT30_9PROT|nr:M2 family metallopeptidase [Marinicauda salina]PWE17173.1 peptidyl-dipeptidase [Marinicauda salina]